MSLRTSLVAAPKSGAAAHGSLFGPAISAPAGGFWSRLAVSPPRSPPAALPQHALLLPEFALDAEMADAEESASGCDAREGLVVLESVCPTWAYDLGDETALIVFDQAERGTMTVCSTPRRVHNRDPVTAKAIVADAVSWRPMRDAATGAAAGHVFQLSRGGAPVCRIEATLKAATTMTGGGGEGDREVAAAAAGQLERVAVVQATYAPLAMASGIADRSSLLVYDDPAAHLRDLQQVSANLRADAELGYAPVSECCVTGHFDRLSPGMPLSTDFATSVEHATARRAWDATKDFLRRMSTLTADCVDQYVGAEIRRTGAHELRAESTAWRRVVV